MKTQLGVKLTRVEHALLSLGSTGTAVFIYKTSILVSM